MSIIKDGFVLSLVNKLNSQSYNKEDSNIYWGRWFLDFSFFVIITLLYTNMIFGIIIDKFGELRD